MEALSIHADGANTQFIFPAARKDVADKSSCRILDFPLHLTDYLEKLFHKLSYKKTRANYSQPQDNAQPVPFYHPFMHNVLSNFWLFTSYRFSYEWAFHHSGFANTRKSYLGHKKLKNELTTWIKPRKRSIPVCCASQRCRRFKLFNIETVGGVDHSQMLDTQVLSEGQQFLENAVSSRMKFPLHTIRLVPSLLDECFPNSWVWRCGPPSCPASSHDVNPQDFSQGICRRQYVSEFWA